MTTGAYRNMRRSVPVILALLLALLAGGEAPHAAAVAHTGHGPAAAAAQHSAHPASAPAEPAAAACPPAAACTTHRARVLHPQHADTVDAARAPPHTQN